MIYSIIDVGMVSMNTRSSLFNTCLYIHDFELAEHHNKCGRVQPHRGHLTSMTSAGTVRGQYLMLVFASQEAIPFFLVGIILCAAKLKLIIIFFHFQGMQVRKPVENGAPGEPQRDEQHHQADAGRVVPASITRTNRVVVPNAPASKVVFQGSSCQR